jgi:simple sugar transport system permease protein
MTARLTPRTAELAGAPSPEDQPSPEAGPPRRRLGQLLVARPETGGAASAVAVFAFFAVMAGSTGFLSSLGTANWLNTAAELGIVAVPIAMLMIAGEFDLSVGAMVGTGSIAVGITTGGYGMSPWTGIIVGLVLGAVVGLANGLIVVRTGLPSFIVTLATMMMITGATLAVSIFTTGSSNVSASAQGLAASLFGSQWRGFGVAIAWWVVVLAAGSWVMTRTTFGNWAYATGGNEQTARLVGVPTATVKVLLFVATSVCAVLSGVIQTLSLGNANVTLGGAFIFEGIAAAVIGGVLLTGGYGAPLGSAFGAVTYGIISTGVLLLGWNADLTELFIGALLLTAVLANHRLRQLALGRR